MMAPVTSSEEDAWLPESLAVNQAEDPEITEFRDLLIQFPDRRPTWSEIEGVYEFSKICWTMWSEFRVEDNVLYRESFNPVTQDKEKRVVLDA